MNIYLLARGDSSLSAVELWIQKTFINGYIYGVANLYTR